MRLSFLLCLAAFTGCKLPQTTQTNAADLEAASAVVSGRPLFMISNVENAFDGIDQGTEHDAFSMKSSNWNQNFALTKAQHVADIFFAANCPEVIVSPEVENQTSANMIAQAAQKCGYKVYSANDDQSNPTGVAIFTSKQVINVAKVNSGYRPHLRVDFADGLTVIGVHFKSMIGGGDALRAQAAKAVKDELTKIAGNRRVIVGGDFNTESDILGNTRLRNCSLNAQPTHLYRGEWHRLDKIYATECGQVSRLNAPFLMKNGEPYRGEKRKEGERFIHTDVGYSDHLALYMMR